ncbi:MAG: DEAD/DEAH box helicase [Treponema sp.]|jgi:superfamily II DNA/RNA helicase|nr:DEAD/DEAH box helicase [Treponema sp.]
MTPALSGFAALGLGPLFIRPLAERGINAPTEIQRRVIPRLLRGEHTLFSSPTGTGKTFAYLLPLLQSLTDEPAEPGASGGPRLLICAPTYELCAQIKGEADFLLREAARDAGTLSLPKTALIIGGGGMGRQIEALKRDKPGVVVGNPGRLLQLAQAGKLRLRSIRSLVLDEGDRLTAKELSAETLALAALLNPQRRSAACSATLSLKKQEQLLPLMGAPVFLENAPGDLLRERIEHWALWSEERRRKSRVLRSLLAAVKPRKALVFAGPGAAAGSVAAELQRRHAAAGALHGDMEKQARKQALEDFRRGRINILVTSDLAARGLDIHEITHIIALDVPADEEAYIHRAGRTARAGKRGVMATIADAEELERLAKLEKRLGITIYPKALYQGRLVAP